MGHAARKDDSGEVIDMVDYIDDTIESIDRIIGDLARERQELAVKRSVIEAGSSPAVHAAADED